MVLYGEETKKALAVLGTEPLPRELIRSYGEVKLAALRAQQRTTHLYSDASFPFLEQAALNIISGVYDDSFILPLEQGGAGTSIHMNICEVLANAAGLLAHEAGGDAGCTGILDQLARFQSTNDTFPTAVIIMTYRFLAQIEDCCIRLQEQLVEREKQYDHVLLAGRTELQDALPVTLGQVFGAWAGPVERDRWRISRLRERLRVIPLGGTAVGTGFSAPREFVFEEEKELQRITKLPVSRSQNLCDQIAHTDTLSECAQGMRVAADNLYKLAGDLLLYTSSFCGEMHHREVQYGSTIMPDKVNPVMLELIRGLSMACASEAGLAADYSRSGQLQLNAYLPFLAASLVRLDARLEKSFRATCRLLTDVLEIDAEKMEADLASSAALVNTLRSSIDYTVLKKLLPQIKAAGFRTKKELAAFIADHTAVSPSVIENQLDIRNITGFMNCVHGEKK
jgi:aspartate ammonia-lyase